jgi:diguanylate cyclase
MTNSTGGDVERSFAIGQRALELIKAYGCPAHPRGYEIWYTYVSGHKPLMNDAIRRIAAEKGTLSDQDLDQIYEAHLSMRPFSMEAERTGISLLGEIDEVMELLDLALGSTARYGESLEGFSKDLAGPADRQRVREVLQSLINVTRDVASTNQTLEARLKETRGEIEGLRETLEAVRLEALTDPLTGIANRKHFEDTLVKAISQAMSQKTPLALIIIDIDHFKHFNDTYGHLTGDQVLRLVGVTMREHVKPKATLARFGGEEFGVILPETTLEAARTVAEQIRHSVMSRELVKRSTGQSLGRVTVSLGVAELRPDDTSVSLLERADQCMFLAKRAGRNRTVTDAEEPGEGLPNAA